MTKLEPKIPIEQLDAERMARIERNVLTAYRGLAREPRSSRRWLLQPLLVAGAVAAVLVAWLVLRPRGGAPTAVVVPPAPEVQRVRTEGGPSTVDLGEATITVDQNTEIEIHRDGGGIQVVLAHGAVDCEVAPREHRPPFVVDAGEVDVTVVGTAFRVERDADVRVTVTHGRVLVASPAGERWLGGQVVAVALAPVADPKLDDRRPVVVPPVERKKIARVDGPAPVVKAGKPPRTDRVRPAEPVRKAPRGSVAAALDLGIDDPRTLITAYTNLVANDPRARHALYSIIWVQWFRQHDRGAAVRSAQHFERRFQGGDYAEDALVIRIMATCNGGPSEDCRAAAHTYVRRFPSGSYFDAARDITEWDVTR